MAWWSHVNLQIFHNTSDKVCQQGNKFLVCTKAFVEADISAPKKHTGPTYDNERHQGIIVRKFNIHWCSLAFLSTDFKAFACESVIRLAQKRVFVLLCNEKRTNVWFCRLLMFLTDMSISYVTWVNKNADRISKHAWNSYPSINFSVWTHVTLVVLPANLLWIHPWKVSAPENYPKIIPRHSKTFMASVLRKFPCGRDSPASKQTTPKTTTMFSHKINSNSMRLWVAW